MVNLVLAVHQHAKFNHLDIFAVPLLVDVILTKLVMVLLQHAHLM